MGQQQSTAATICVWIFILSSNNHHVKTAQGISTFSTTTTTTALWLLSTIGSQQQHGTKPQQQQSKHKQQYNPTSQIQTTTTTTKRIQISQKGIQEKRKQGRKICRINNELQRCTKLQFGTHQMQQRFRTVNFLHGSDLLLQQRAGISSNPSGRSQQSKLGQLLNLPPSPSTLRRKGQSTRGRTQTSLIGSAIRIVGLQYGGNGEWMRCQYFHQGGEWRRGALEYRRERDGVCEWGWWGDAAGG
mmetsp:Transcript_27094/g.48890  ORF Transcript_27094/g.48890 Transcript_27094/m.48890 type:complete len:244 (-) Transcript_27094:6-737(-)